MPKPLSPDDQATFNKGLAAVQDLAERLTFRGFTCKVKTPPSQTKLTIRVSRTDPSNGTAMQLTGLVRSYTLAQLKAINVDDEEESFASDDWGVDIPPALTTANLTMLTDVDALMARTKDAFDRNHSTRKHANILTWERYEGTVRPYMEDVAHLARALLAGKKPSP